MELCCCKQPSTCWSLSNKHVRTLLLSLRIRSAAKCRSRASSRSSRKDSVVVEYNFYTNNAFTAGQQAVDISSGAHLHSLCAALVSQRLAPSTPQWMRYAQSLAVLASGGHPHPLYTERNMTYDPQARQPRKRRSHGMITKRAYPEAWRACPPPPYRFAYCQGQP